MGSKGGERDGRKIRENEGRLAGKMKVSGKESWKKGGKVEEMERGVVKGRGREG